MRFFGAQTAPQNDKQNPAFRPADGNLKRAARSVELQYTTMRTLRVMLILAAGFVFEHPIEAQRPSASKGFQATVFVSCLDQEGKITGSRRVRSPWLISPNGKSRVFAEAEVEAHSRDESGSAPYAPPCTNTTRVYLADSEKGQARPIYIQEPTKDTPGNGVELADWSPDGRYLLMTVHEWVYESDSFGFGLVIYDAETGDTVRPQVGKLFSQHFGQEYWAEFRALGFTNRGQAVIDAWDSPEEAGCLGKKGRWVIDWQQNTIRPLDDKQKVRRYGRVQR